MAAGVTPEILVAWPSETGRTCLSFCLTSAPRPAMARAAGSVKRAADRVEYAETAAKYEILNLSTGEIGEGLSVEEIRAICANFNVDQTIF